MSGEPVYFLSLELENVRCFGPRQTLDLSDGAGKPRMWTVILGENGVGKTTVLQGLANSKPRRGFNFSAVGAKITRTPVSSFGLATAHSWLRDGEIRATAVTAALGGKQWRYDWSNAGSSDPEKWVDPGLALGAVMFAYGASRGNTASELREEPPSPDDATLFDPKAELVNAEEWLLRLDYASLAEGRSGPSEARLHQVRALLLALLPGVTDVSVAPKTGARFLTEYGWVPLRALSLGYQTMIAWTVDLAWRMVRRYPDAADPLAEPAVVLVDEIDLHLHPRWQRELIDFLSARFPRTQFIVTAHSPLIVQAATEANVVVLRREGDHVVIENNAARVKAWRVDQLLTSDLFGLEGSRAPAVEKLLDERADLMSKRRLRGADRKRIAAIEAELGPVPTAERSADEEAMQIIRAAAAAIQGGARG